MLSSYQSDANYWIQQDRDNYIKDLYSLHKERFPKINKEHGFSQLSSIDNLKTIPWPLYVMALTKNLNPAANPNWSMSDGKICCNICRIYFVPDAKDNRGECAVRKVDGLYKLHKEVYKFSDYDVCSACYYALQNAQIMLDYPKSNRLHDHSEYYVQSFVVLKRSSNFGYHGKLIIGDHAYLQVLEVALLIEDCGCLSDNLNITDYAG